MNHTSFEKEYISMFSELKLWETLDIFSLLYVNQEEGEENCKVLNKIHVDFF